MTTKPLSIGARLAIGYGAIFLLMILLAALATARVGQVDALLGRIGYVTDAKLRYAAELRISVRDRAIALRDVVLAPDAAAASAPISHIKSLDDTYARAASPLGALFQELPDVLPAEREALAAIKDQERRTRPLIERVAALHAAGQGLEASALLSQQAAPAFVDWLASIQRFIDLQEKLRSDDAYAARQLSSDFPGWMLLLCIGAIAAAFPGAWFILRGLPQAAQQDPKGEAPVSAAPARPPRAIADIVSAIDGIAFQANIVALDAAMEAVRSGSRDGSVAVVAQDVQALAQRFAAVAQDIRTLVAHPVNPGECDGRLEEIVEAVGRLAGITERIGIDACGDAADSGGTVYGNAAILHVAAAATVLEAEAGRLSRVVGSLLVQDGAAPAVLSAG